MDKALKAIEAYLLSSGVASVHGVVVTWLADGLTTPCDDHQQALLLAFRYVAKRVPPPQELFDSVEVMLTQQNIRTLLRCFLGHASAAYTDLGPRRRLHLMFLDKFARLQVEVLRAPRWDAEGRPEWRVDRAYGFVALDDSNSRSLGPVKAGDILYPASFKRPAKHARGNLFDRSTWRCAGPVGLTTMR